MRKSALVVVALAGLVVAFLVWRQRDSHSTPPGEAAAKPGDASVAAVTAAVAVPSRPTLTPEQPPPDEPGEEFPLDPEREQQVAALHRELIVAATPCYHQRAHPPVAVEPGAPDETMQEFRVRYTVVVAGGRGMVSAVERADPADPASTLGTPLQDQDLGDCILDAIRKAEWSTEDADETLQVVDTISVGELDRPAPTPRSPRPPIPAHADDVPPPGTVVDP